MSDPAAVVYLEIDGVVRSVGRLWVSATREAQHASFEFRLVEREARKLAGQIARSVGEWRALAEQMKIGKLEIDRMATAFEHEEASLAKHW